MFNYTHEFAYTWDELSIPVRYSSDYAAAEECLLSAATNHALSCHEVGEDEVRRLENRFGIDVSKIDPRIFWRMTEDWLEMTVRFLGPHHGIRGIKDRMTRDIMAGFDKEGVAVGATREGGARNTFQLKA